MLITPRASSGPNRVSFDRPLGEIAAETGDPIAEARRKLESKACDLIVANDVSAPGAGFGTDTNEVTFVGTETAESLPLTSKDQVAHELLSRVLQLLKG